MLIGVIIIVVLWAGCARYIAPPCPRDFGGRVREKERVHDGCGITISQRSDAVCNDDSHTPSSYTVDTPGTGGECCAQTQTRAKPSFEPSQPSHHHTIQSRSGASRLKAFFPLRVRSFQHLPSGHGGKWNGMKRRRTGKGGLRSKIEKRKILWHKVRIKFIQSPDARKPHPCYAAERVGPQATESVCGACVLCYRSPEDQRGVWLLHATLQQAPADSREMVVRRGVLVVQSGQLHAPRMRGRTVLAPFLTLTAGGKRWCGNEVNN